MEKILWTPTFFEGYEFGVSLDHSFSKEVISKKLPERLAGKAELVS